MSTVATLDFKPRYTFGGDEFLFVEISEEMSLEAFFHGILLSQKLQSERPNGVSEICPANASLQIRFDPDVISAEDLQRFVEQCDASSDSGQTQLTTRLIELPVYYNDPWTHETLMRFRERHQDPQATDLQYAARINHFADVEAFIAAHHQTPWFVSMVGFVAGLPFMYQMVERDKQLQVPKYLSPRTDTPKQTLGHGGCFSCIYSVRGAGGYQMFGITPAPIYDPTQTTPYLADFMIFFKPGDIVKFRPIDRAEHDYITEQVAAERYQLPIRPVNFSLQDYQQNPKQYVSQLLSGDFS